MFALKFTSTCKFDVIRGLALVSVTVDCMPRYILSDLTL